VDWNSDLGDPGETRSEISLLVIDEPPAGSGIAQALSETGVRVVGTYGYGRHIPGTVLAQRPDVILVGLRNPIQRSLRSLTFASFASGRAPVLAFADHERSDLFELARQAMQSGARDMFTIPIPGSGLNEIMSKAILLEEQLWNARDSRMEDVLPQGEIIVLFGTKGGVGKTTFAVNLSYAHSSLSDERVVLLDLDPTLGGISSILHTEALKSITSKRLETIAGDQGVESLLSLSPMSTGELSVVRVKDEFQGSDDELATSELRNSIQLLSRVYDYVYVDAAAKWNDQMKMVLEQATMVLWVVTPELGTVTNARSALSMASEIPFIREKVKVILNRADLDGGLSVEEVERAIGYPVVWEMPEDKTAVTASRQGTPLVELKPDAGLSKSLLDLLYVISGVRSVSQPGTWQKMLSKLRLRKNQQNDSISHFDQLR
jgi:pilus assembly protein CpaE